MYSKFGKVFLLFITPSKKHHVLYKNSFILLILALKFVIIIKIVFLRGRVLFG